MTTVYSAFSEVVRDASDRPLLVAPFRAGSAQATGMLALSYGEASIAVEALKAQYGTAGWGHGDRIALLLDNGWAFLRHWLAANALGASVVPLNPDYRSAELGPLLEHSEATLVVAPHTRAVELCGIARTLARPASVLTAEHEGDIPHAPQAKATSPEASAILYTSGTTGHPKGCMLDDGYFLAAGRWYLTEGGLCAIRRGEERMLTPLPLFYMDAMAFSFMATVLSAGCLILLDRFHPNTWWETVAAQRASIVHYLGVMPAMLLARATSPAQRGHAVRFGFGAGVSIRRTMRISRRASVFRSSRSGR